jgi:putative addiction module CopG family antidote
MGGTAQEGRLSFCLGTSRQELARESHDDSTSGHTNAAFFAAGYLEDRYASASDVVCDALRLLEEKEAKRLVAIERLRALWDEGVRSGLGEEWDVVKAKQRMRLRLKEREKVKAA